MSKIDHQQTKEDRKYLRMTPDERHLYLQSHYGAEPTREQCTDESVIAWFENSANNGRQRLELAKALCAPAGTSPDDLLYWQGRARDLLGETVTVFSLEA